MFYYLKTGGPIMITEDYVSFETAKLLKDKGFDEPCLMCYTSDKELGNYGHYHSYKNSDVFSLTAPTIQMAMKWLIQKYRLYVNVTPNVVDFYWTEKWNSYVEDLNKRYPLGRFIGTFDSPEQACDAAIKYCLENLI